MSTIKYQNPVTVDAVLDSALLGGSPELRREIIVVGDSAGNNAGVTVGGALKTDASATTQPVSGNVGITGALPAGANVIGHVIVDSGAATVSGGKTNNNAAPGATNVGVLPAIANAAAPTYTEGDQVLESLTLSGAQRVDILSLAGTVLGAPANYGTSPGAVKALGVNAFITNTIAATISAGAAIIGKVDLLGNAGAAMDSTVGASSAPANALLTSVMYNSTVPVLSNGQAVARQSDSTGGQYVNATGRLATYRACAPLFTPLSDAAKPTISLQGSGTKTIRILRIKISITATTGVAVPTGVNLQKFSVLSGGTTGTTPVIGSLDSSNAAATAICLQYSGLPSTATAIGGNIASEMLKWTTGSVTVNTLSPATEFDFGTYGGQPLTLRGTGEYLGIVCNATIGATPVMSVWIEWTEE